MTYQLQQQWHGIILIIFLKRQLKRKPAAVLVVEIVVVKLNKKHAPKNKENIDTQEIILHQGHMMQRGLTTQVILNGLP